MDRAKSIYSPLLDKAQSIIEGSSSYAEAKARLGQHIAMPEFIHHLGSHLFESISSADALGRSFVIQKDRHFSALHHRRSARYNFGKFVVSAAGMNWFVCQNEAVRISFDLVPQAALDYMREKSFWIAGVENQDVLDAIQAKLEEALEAGITYDEFKTRVKDVLNALGLSDETPYRLDTIFRTNIFSAYTMGQLEQVQGLQDRFPLWRYLAIIDSRTRPLHRDLNGKIFRQGEGPIPPIDFNCRCTMQMLHQFEIERGGLVVTPAGELKAILHGSKPISFDQKRDFNRWLDQKKAGLDAGIRSAIENALK